MYNEQTRDCSTCGGKGYVTETCSSCGGSPSKYVNDEGYPDECSTCGDDGYVEEPCSDCGGSGEINDE